MKLRRSPETIARIAARPVDAAHAVGALIITASADLKVLYELQYFAGGCRNNLVGQLRQQFAQGRTEIAICLLFDFGFGRLHTQVNMAPEYDLNSSARAVVRTFVGLKAEEDF